MKKIIVPTDFSRNAYWALYYVSKLYADETVEIILLHSFENSPGRSNNKEGSENKESLSVPEQVEKNGRQLLEKIKQDTEKESHSFRFQSTSDNLIKTINRIIADEGVDLVALGSRGLTGFELALMGSTAEKITERISGCPLLIVPREVNFMVPSNIAFSTDYNDFLPISGLRPISRLVRHYNSTIQLVHVGEKADLSARQKENFERFLNDLSEYDIQLHFIPKAGSISDTLNQFVENKQIDILSLVYHKHAFIKALFREPVVNKMGKHAHVPTLVIPETK